MKHTTYTLDEIMNMSFLRKEFIYHSILYDYEVMYGKSDEQSNRIEIDDMSIDELRSKLGHG